MQGILLVNLGTPKSPSTGDVRRYLRTFLMDPYVIDIPFISRWLLVNLIIAPFRAPKSAAAYQKIWTDAGSPLLLHSRHLAQAVQTQLGNDYKVALGMRYGEPSIQSALQELKAAEVESIKVLPLYPHYAESSTRTVVEHTRQTAQQEGLESILSFLPPFYENKGFIQSAVAQARSTLNGSETDYYLFSFHGLPERHITKVDPTQQHCLQTENCCDVTSEALPTCYRAQCFRTARAMAQALGLNEEQYGISFQSRLGRTPWLKPYTDLVLPELAQQGKRRVAVFCPAFVADCLETLEEIGIRGKELFVEAGGEDLQTVPCVNSHPEWVNAVCQLVA